jgi:hypothetical protein
VIDGDGGDSSAGAKKAKPVISVPTSRPPTTYTQKPPKAGKRKSK